jgi:hypothetical protein
MELFNRNQKAETVYLIPDNLWKNIHETYADQLKTDFFNAERSIDFQMQDATRLSRAEIERQHVEYHRRNCFKTQGGLKRTISKVVHLTEDRKRIKRR